MFLVSCGFGVVLRILSLNDLTSRRNLVLNPLNLSKKSFLNWSNCSMISSFSVSISWKFSFGSDIHSRFLNVLTMTYSFLVKEFNVSVKMSEDISNSTDSSTMLHTSIKSTMSFLLLFSVCIDEIMRSVNSFSVMVTIDSKLEFASSIF